MSEYTWSKITGPDDGFDRFHVDFGASKRRVWLGDEIREDGDEAEARALAEQRIAHEAKQGGHTKDPIVIRLASAGLIRPDDPT